MGKKKGSSALNRLAGKTVVVSGKFEYGVKEPLATPFPYGSCICYSLPVLTGALDGRFFRLDSSDGQLRAIVELQASLDLGFPAGLGKRGCKLATKLTGGIGPQ